MFYNNIAKTYRTQTKVCGSQYAIIASDTRFVPVSLGRQQNTRRVFRVMGDRLMATNEEQTIDYLARFVDDYDGAIRFIQSILVMDKTKVESIILNRKQLEQRLEYERENRDQLVTVECWHCGEMMTRGECVMGKVVEHKDWMMSFHPECLKKYTKVYGVSCDKCGVTFINTNSDNAILCDVCRTPENIKELRRLQLAIRRAEKAGNEANLTLADWLSAIDAFGGMCGYCGENHFTDLEHFIPLKFGGGTTKRNCLPACHTCNMAKGHKHPDLITGIMKPQIDKARSWLAAL